MMVQEEMGNDGAGGDGEWSCKKEMGNGGPGRGRWSFFQDRMGWSSVIAELSREDYLTTAGSH
jgi:hypothetical protein